MGWLNSWKKRIKLTVDNTNIDGTLSDFPVLIKISNSSGISSTDVTSVFTELGSDANRKKIAVTTSDGTAQCYVEIERFDYSNSVAWLWVKVPSVSAGATTDLYLYYDSTQTDNTSYVGDTTDVVTHNVWDANFKAVYHHEGLIDSTANAKDLTKTGTVNTVAGKISNASSAVWDKNNCLTRTALLGANLGTGDATISVIILKNGASTVDYTPTIIMLGAYPGDRIYLIAAKTNGYAGFSTYGGTSIDALSTVNICDDVTHTITGVREGTSVKIYVDGVLAASNTGTVQDITGDTLAFGNSNYDPTDVLGQATIGKSQVSNIARSAAWIKATYYSNWDGLVSFGTEETEAVNYISGYVKEGTIPVNRQIYLHNRDTGELITSTTSSGAGGYFYCGTTYSGAHYVVCFDDDLGSDYNDLIYGNIYPTTVSG